MMITAWTKVGSRLSDKVFYVDEGESVSPEKAADVERYTLTARFVTTPRRERGRYTHKDAEAILELDQGGRVAMYEVAFSSQSIDALRELLEQIKAGSIRPTESFEGEQSGMSRSELERELAITRAKLVASETERKMYHDDTWEVRGKLYRLKTFCDLLDGERLPLCPKGRVTRQIREVLASTK